MCRMIIACGIFSSRDVLDAARAMSAGETAAHDSPIKQHPNGWGCLWIENDKIKTMHSEGNFAEESLKIDSSKIDTKFLAVHVRHATLSRNSGVEFSHPLHRRNWFTDWHMMHNGYLPTVYEHLGLPASTFDSAEYLEYIVQNIEPAQLTRDHLLTKLSRLPPGGSAGNSFLVTPDNAWVWQWHPEDTPHPKYFTIHHFQTGQAEYFSSEAIQALGDLSIWRPMKNSELYQITFSDLGINA
ncbi:class II glutamine amidotransferase [Pseudomonas sp. LB3P31]